MLSWLQSSLISRAPSPYPALASVIVHALTGSFFTLIMWVTDGGCALATVTLLCGPYGHVRDKAKRAHVRASHGSIS